MRSVDTQTQSPLQDFEAKISALLENPKMQNAERDLKKGLIRTILIKSAESLKINDVQAQFFAMYFFHLIENDPDNFKRIWELLKEISDNAENPDKIAPLFTEIVSLNKGGKTFLWRLVHSIVRGDYEVMPATFGGEPIFYLKEPGDSENRRQNQNRQKSNVTLKKAISSEIVDKPLPDGNALRGFYPDEIKIFSQIYKYLQDDIDVLIFSSLGPKFAEGYLSNIIQFMHTMIKELEIQPGGRKSKYYLFIKNIIKNYLQPLLAYAKKLSEESEKNEFAKDLWLEPYLIQNELLKNYKAQSPFPVIERKWEQLKIQLSEYVRKNISKSGTVMGIPTYNEELIAALESDLTFDDFSETPPKAVPVSISTGIKGKKALDQTMAYIPSPRLTGEIDQDILAEVNRRAEMANKTREALGDQPIAAEPSIIINPPDLEELVLKFLEEDDDADPIVQEIRITQVQVAQLKLPPRARAEDDTAPDANKAALANATTDVQIQAQPSHTAKIEPINKHEIFSSVVNIFNSYDDLRTEEGVNELMFELKLIAQKASVSHMLKRDFVQAVMLNLAGTKREESSSMDLKHLYEKLGALLSDTIGATLPSTSTFKLLENHRPKLTDYPKVGEVLMKKGINTEVRDLEEFIEQFEEELRKMEALIAFDDNFKIAPDAVGGFLCKAKKLEEGKSIRVYPKDSIRLKDKERAAMHEEGINEKIAGLKNLAKIAWLSRGFRKIGKRKDLNSETKEYFERLELHFERIKRLAIDPTINFFKVAYFYTRNESPQDKK